MNNAVTSLEHFGYRTFYEMPFCDLDAILLCSIAYLDLHHFQYPLTIREVAREYFRNRDVEWIRADRDEATLRIMAESERYRDAVLYAPVWLSGEMSFACLTLFLPDGTCAISFRGLLGNMEDWHNSFRISNGVTYEEENAEAYLRYIIHTTARPIRLIGHSFGSNLAMHAVMKTEHKDRIRGIWCLDGVGIYPTQQYQEGYLDMLKKVRRINPSHSVIGRLFECDVPARIIRSTAEGLDQHSPLTWVTDGYDLVDVAEYEASSVQWTRILNDWIVKADYYERKTFIKQFFHAMETDGYNALSDIAGASLQEKADMMKALQKTDWKTRRQFLVLMKLIAEENMPEAAEKIREASRKRQKHRYLLEGLKDYYQYRKK